MENVELDKPLARAPGADFEFKVTLQAGESRREAMVVIHHSSCFEQLIVKQFELTVRICSRW